MESVFLSQMRNLRAHNEVEFDKIEDTLDDIVRLHNHKKTCDAIEVEIIQDELAILLKQIRDFLVMCMQFAILQILRKLGHSRSDNLLPKPEQTRRGRPKPANLRTLEKFDKMLANPNISDLKKRNE